MTSDPYGQLVYTDHDIIDLLMQGQQVSELSGLLVDHSVNHDALAQVVQDPPLLVKYVVPTESVEEFDRKNQNHWHMPEHYQQLDIAAHVLSLCQSDAELQRCGHELMLYQERGLFDLLRYLKYLVDIMRKHNIIWGVGRGSSVASYVLYLLGAHRIDSMYYNLDIREFLR